MGKRVGYEVPALVGRASATATDVQASGNLCDLPGESVAVAWAEGQPETGIASGEDPEVEMARKQVEKAYRLEWLVGPDKPNRIIAEGDFNSVYYAFHTLVESAPFVPFDTPVVILELGKDENSHKRVLLFAFGWPQDGEELPVMAVANRKGETVNV